MKRRLNIFESLNSNKSVPTIPVFIPSEVLNDLFVMTFESNEFIIKTEYKMSQDVIFSILSIYGQIENFKMEEEINISYYDTRSAKRAYNEISFNFEKMLNYQTDKYLLSYVKNKKEFYERFLLVVKFTNEEVVEKLIKYVDFHCETDKIYKSQDELMFRFFNMKDKIKLLFFLSKLGKCESGYPKDKVCRTEEYIRSLPLLRENSSKEEPKKPDTLILKEVTLPKQKIDNKSNIVSKKIKTEDKENYKIVYDKNYTGIKKRNTPAEEIQNYVINIEDIINEKDTRTTLMIKNLPPNTNQVELLEKINYNHKDDYNFFYLPIDFTTKSNAGYAFINFKSAKSIINFFLEFNNKPWGFKNSNKIAYVSYARIQGFRALSSHFKKSHIMKQVDGKVKPMIIN